MLRLQQSVLWVLKFAVTKCKKSQLCDMKSQFVEANRQLWEIYPQLWDINSQIWETKSMCYSARHTVKSQLWETKVTKFHKSQLLDKATIGWCKDAILRN